MRGVEIEGAELVHADHAAVVGRVLVEPADGPVLAVVGRIWRFFPGFRASPANAAAAQQRAQVLDADRADDAPLDQAGRRWFHPNPTIGQVFFG